MGTTDYCFSFFRKPIQNIEPIRAVGIVDVYRYVIGHYAQLQTESLRSMLSSPEAKRYKTSAVIYRQYTLFDGRLFTTRDRVVILVALNPFARRKLGLRHTPKGHRSI